MFNLNDQSQQQQVTIDDISPEAYRKKHFSAGDIPNLTKMLTSPNPDSQLSAVIGFRKMLSEESGGPIMQVFDSGCVPYLIAAAKRVDNPALQYEALWALTNLASGTSDAVVKLLEMGMAKICVDALGGSPEIQEQALWAIGNLAGDSAHSRDMVLKQGGLTALAAALLDPVNTNKTTFVRNGIWALSNLCRGRPLPEFKYCAPAINPLIRVIRETSDQEILTDAAWALSYLSDSGTDRIERLVRSGVVPRLVELISSPTLSISIPCIRTLGNISTGTTFQTQSLLDADFIETARPLLNSHKKSVRKEVLWALSNITAGEPDQIAIFTSNQEVLASTLSMARNDVADVAREAIWVLSNALAHCNEDSRKVLLNCGVLEVFKWHLNSDSEKILCLILEALKNLFSDCRLSQPSIKDPLFLSDEDRRTYDKQQDIIKGLGVEGLSQLEQLQYHPNQTIYSHASDLILKNLAYKEGDEKEDPSVDILRDLTGESE